MVYFVTMNCSNVLVHISTNYQRSNQFLKPSYRFVVKVMVITEKGGDFLGQRTSLPAVEHVQVYTFTLI